MYNSTILVDRITQLCQNKNLSINQMLKDANLSVSVIDNIKRGRIPSVDKIDSIADFFNCSIDYLLGRSNNPSIQKNTLVELTSNNKTISYANKSSKKNTIIKPYYTQSASAGTGIFLFDDAPSEWMNVPKNEISKNSDFIIQIKGDSMFPNYVDGDKVFVEKTLSILEGEVGIFILDGESYIKKMGKGELISINPDYGNIPINEYSDCRYIGKVIGKVDE